MFLFNSGDLNQKSLLVKRQNDISSPEGNKQVHEAQWKEYWSLVLKVPSSIRAAGEETFVVRKCFPSCHLQGGYKQTAPSFGSD